MEPFDRSQVRNGLFITGAAYPAYSAVTKKQPVRYGDPSIKPCDVTVAEIKQRLAASTADLADIATGLDSIKKRIADLRTLCR